MILFVMHYRDISPKEIYFTMQQLTGQKYIQILIHVITYVMLDAILKRCDTLTEIIHAIHFFTNALPMQAIIFGGYTITPVNTPAFLQSTI